MSEGNSSEKTVRLRRQRRRGPVTADELMARLEADPEWVARREERHRQWRAGVEENLWAAAPLEADLRKAGVPVASVSELMDCRLEGLRPAIPVLLRWLPRMENIDIKECIVRALTDKAAKPLAAPALIEEFRKAPITDDPRLLSFKWAIGNALSVVADDLVFDDIAELLRDERHRWSRDMLCIALGRMKNPHADDVLLVVLDQDRGLTGGEASVTRYAIRALGNRKASKAKTHIERLLDHPEVLVRREARKSLEKIEKAERKARESEPRS